jgi:hypothetical protein
MLKSIMMSREPAKRRLCRVAFLLKRFWDCYQPLRLRLSRIDADFLLVFPLPLKGHNAIHEGKQRIVTPPTHIITRMKLGTPLTNENTASRYSFTTIPLNAQAF